MIVTNANPIRSRIDWKTSNAAVKEILKDGTPKWVSHPLDFKRMAQEDYLASKEQSDAGASLYKLQDQNLFTDHAQRLIHPMDTRRFIGKLRDNGISCFTHQTPYQPGIPLWLANTTGLFCKVPVRELLGYQRICNLRIPMMYEWSIILTDEHDLQKAHIIGWRTALSQLIIKRVLTEAQAHAIYGEPRGATSRRYRNTLYQFRNGRLKENDGKQITDLA